MSHKFLCSVGYLVRTIGRDVMEIACFAASQNPDGSARLMETIYFNTCCRLMACSFFASELRDYLLGHVRSLKSLDMIKEYIWKDYGVNWR